MNIPNDCERLEHRKEQLFERYRYIQSIEQSRRDPHDVAFVENFQAAIRLWGWNWIDAGKLSKK
jgi:hypothetical protein